MKLLTKKRVLFPFFIPYTKKKKIGLFYQKDLNKIDATNLKNKWFGALARRGFSYETAKRVFEIDNLSEAENIINRTV